MKKFLSILLAVLLLGSVSAIGVSAAQTYHIGVAYDLNGGFASSELWNEYNARPHTTATFPDGMYPAQPLYRACAAPSRAKYKFCGWQVSREGISQEGLLQPGDSLIGWGWWTLKAVWEPTRWYATLPPVVQWILRWLCFGWIWM